MAKSAPNINRIDAICLFKACIVIPLEWTVSLTAYADELFQVDMKI